MSARQALGTVGIIANPASGKDIRRLIAQATTVDNQQKISILRRLISGLTAAGMARILLMPDDRGMAQKAIRQPLLSGKVPALEWLDLDASGSPTDSVRAADLLKSENAACIIVLGGDGTVRDVSKGCGAVPIMPLSTGTNNVVPYFVEATIAGMAAGALARGDVDLSTVAYQHKWLEVSIAGQVRDRALVDVALLRGRFVGSRAVWDARSLLGLLVTRADPASVGMSAIAGNLQPVDPEEPHGLLVWLDPKAERQIIAPLGPGLVGQVGVRAIETVAIGQQIDYVAAVPTVVALDGERELVLLTGQMLSVCLRSDGPWIVNAEAIMRLLAARHHLDVPTPDDMPGPSAER